MKATPFTIASKRVGAGLAVAPCRFVAERVREAVGGREPASRRMFAPRLSGRRLGKAP